MKKTLKLLSVLFLAVPLLYISVKVYAGELTSPVTVVKQDEIKITQEQKEKFTIKMSHAKNSFDCVFCHEGQGTNPEEFEAPDEEVCLSCHKSKEYLAERLAFMDTLKANPHNSIHDGPNLYCDECHNEHKPSINMCAECHEKEVPSWMKDVTP